MKLTLWCRLKTAQFAQSNRNLLTSCNGLCLAGAYHTTSLDKLKRLFNVVDIVDVVRAMCGFGTNADGAETDVDYGQMKSRELAWFITGHGPFNAYLHRFNLSESEICRFCGDHSETPEHLLFDCRRFEQQHTSDLRELEAKAKFVVREIYKMRAND